MESASVRKRRVEWALAVTQDTSAAASAYERKLLDKYVHGILTLEEVIILVETQKQAKKSG
jgi:hypothetical protein